MTDTFDERALLNGLREIPDGGVRDELVALMLELLNYARDPHCPQAQGDGVPCATVSLACEQCQQVQYGLAVLRSRLSARLNAPTRP